MAAKDKPGHPPANKGASASADTRAAAPGSVVPREGIFGDIRSGRDRREEGPKVNDPRRVNPERRRGKNQAAWWLERDYVESHHFVQKATAGRPASDDDSTS